MHRVFCSSLPLQLLLLLVLGLNSAYGLNSAEEATAAFLASVTGGNACSMLELLTEDSRAEAIGAADSLHGLLIMMETATLGEFFSGLGFEAAPDEIELWQSADFLEILLISSVFDSTCAIPEEIDGTWRINVKNGVFMRMLENLDLH